MGKITFRSEACKGCELCMAFCYKKLLAPDQNYLNKGGVHPMAITNESECVACGNCSLMCPDGIIRVERG
ncbi:MAG: ferredoxin family protein [Oscillospiraceae bacterium]